MTVATLVLLMAFVPMILEAARSRRNERLLRDAGAVEPVGDVYRLMQIAYPACFVAIVAEAWVRGAPIDLTFVAGLAVFACAKALKYLAIWSLGDRWTFRVLVPPNLRLVTTGPYRFLRHPNYVGVAGELIGAAMMAHAPATGVLSLLGFGGLMLVRIRVEERALGVSQ